MIARMPPHSLSIWVISRTAAGTGKLMIFLSPRRTAISIATAATSSSTFVTPAEI
jgi:hypothetical protein